MSTHFISRRIQLLIQVINDYSFPSKESIIEILVDRDFKISSRTLERDIERVRADFGLEIEYNKKENGYFINEEKSVKVESFFKFLEIITVADIFTESLRDSNKILDYVSFDDSKNFKGIDLLKDFLLAINQERDISFVHENYERKSKKEYNITPLLLKEYLNRWYIIGAIPNDDVIRTFGIDRVSEVEIKGISTKKRTSYKERLEKFDNVVGLTYNNDEPQKICLLVNELHVKYMRSLPLHNSQIIHPKNIQGQHHVDFYLIPNYEFKTQILKIGSEVKVMAPDYLREEIKEMLIATLNNYI
jgi:predicted DNA-binding transcriptional regulator YafY